MTATSSALQDLITRSAGCIGDTAQVRLAVQIVYTLAYQHDWTDLRIHLRCQSKTMPAPMISGLPPQRLYVNPDEQIELLQKQKQAGKVGLPDMPSEREWVLPTHLRDRWTLHRFAAIFDAITVVPEDLGGIAVPLEQGDRSGPESVSDRRDNPWRKTKRLALATLDDDSTVSFYIMHDGIVKPRQN